MEVLVVRHAVAYERNARQWPNDNLRPLTPAGKRKFARAARSLKRLDLRPQRVLTSPLVRARQTAKILANAAKWPAAVESAELAPEYSTADVIGVLRRFKSKLIAVVGHEPGLSRLISACIAGTPAAASIELKKGAVACISFKGKPRPGGATLRWLLTPSSLRVKR